MQTVIPTLELWPKDSPSPLACATPARPANDTAWKALTLLLFVTFVPRAVMAWKQDVVLPDGGFYITLAERLEQGDFASAFTGGLRLNTFPVVLMLLHRAGIDWELAGKLWSLLMSTLVVLPLYGWVRRQFNDRVALVACLLYACHLRFIQWGTEVFRDPTFWFVAMLYWYLAWRAVLELRMWQFAAAGMALFLAIHTRTEGWLLLIPAAVWGAWRFHCLSIGRWRVPCGNALGLAVTPLLVVLINVTWLRHHPHWETGHFEPVLRLFRSAPAAPSGVSLNASPTPIVAGSHDVMRTDGLTPEPSLTKRTSTATVCSAMSCRFPLASLRAWYARFTPVRKFALKLAKAFEPIYGMFFLLGLWRWRKTLRRVDQWAVAILGAVLCGGVWLYTLKHLEINSRYFYLLVLLASPYAALGCLAFCQALSGWTERHGWRSPRSAIARVAVALALVVTGPCLAWTEDYTPRRQDAALGRWLGANYPASSEIGCSFSDGLIVFYAQKNRVALPENDLSAWSRQVAQWKPQILLINEKHYHSSQRPDVVALCKEAHELGYVEIPPESRPSKHHGDHVFVTRIDVPQSAQRHGPAGTADSNRE